MEARHIRTYETSFIYFKDGSYHVAYSEYDEDDDHIYFKTKSFKSLRLAKVFAKLKNKKYRGDAKFIVAQMIIDEDRRKMFYDHYRNVTREIVKIYDGLPSNFFKHTGL